MSQYLLLTNFMREHLTQQRKKLSAEFRAAAAAKIQHNLVQLTEFKNAKNIALYLAVNGEVETQNIIETCWQQNKTVFLPVVQKKFSLSFFQYQRNDALKKNSWGILEPNTNKKNIAANDLDLVIVPIVGFDANNNRLGMGSGCYDRSFAFKTTTPILIGLAYAFQKIEITAQRWDVKMDRIITEN